MDLEKLPNLGKVIIENLKKVGITTADELIKMGSEEAFMKILIIDNTACLNMLYALEGAIRNIRWHYLDDNIKRELKEFYNSL